MHVASILPTLLGASLALARSMSGNQQDKGGAASLSPRHLSLSNPPQVNSPFVSRGEDTASREAADEEAEHRAVLKRFGEYLERTAVAVNWLLENKKEFFVGTWSEERDAALIAARRFGFVDDDDVAEYRSMFPTHKPRDSYVAQAKKKFGRAGIQALSELLDSNDKLLIGIDPAKIDDPSESRQHPAGATDSAGDTDSADATDSD